MFASLLADGFGSGLTEKVAAYVIKGLAVAGGFLIGYFLGKAVAWGLDRWVFANKTPDQLKKAVSLVSGVAIALLVAILVFGEGGNGLFGSGGGNGKEKGQPATPDNGKTAPVTPEPKEVPTPKPVEPPKPGETPKPTPGDVRVSILSGADVKEGTDKNDPPYYLIENDPNPKTIKQLRDYVAARQKANPAEKITIVVRFDKEPLSATHKAVRQVDDWVKEAKLVFRYE